MVILLALLAASDWREWNGKGLAAQRTGSYAEAVAAFEGGLREAGADRGARAQLGNNLAAALYSMGMLAEAERAYERALAEWEGFGGAPSSDRAICRLNLAVLLRQTARLDDARRQAELAADEMAKAGTSGKTLASAHQTRAEIARLQGRFDEAATQLDAASKALESAPDEVLRAHILQTRGTLWQDRGEPARGEPLHRAAVEAFERSVGPSHPQAIAARVAHGQAVFAIGNLAQAEAILAEGLAASERAFGAAHPKVGTAANNLAQVYLAQGRFGDAEPLYRRALAIFQASPGPRHPDTARVTANLGDLFAAQGKSRGAEQLYRLALEITEETVGAAHPQTAVILEKLARLLEHQKRSTELRRVRGRLEMFRTENR